MILISGVVTVVKCGLNPTNKLLAKKSPQVNREFIQPSSSLLEPITTKLWLVAVIIVRNMR